MAQQCIIQKGSSRLGDVPAICGGSISVSGIQLYNTYTGRGGVSVQSRWDPLSLSEVFFSSLVVISPPYPIHPVSSWSSCFILSPVCPSYAPANTHWVYPLQHPAHAITRLAPPHAVYIFIIVWFNPACPLHTSLHTQILSNLLFLLRSPASYFMGPLVREWCQ